MSFGFGVLIALSLLVIPGAIIARAGRLAWPTAIAVGPALTYGTVAVAIVPFGALGIPWNGWTAFFALAAVTALALCLRKVLGRFRDADAESRSATRGPALLVAGGVLLGALLIGLAAFRGIHAWQSIPSTWDSVWHANTIRFILETGQASPTHMGELRNIETHEALYYPSTFHALGSVLSQLTGAAPTTAYTLSSVTAAIWLFPVSAATLTWHLLRGRTGEWRTAGAAATSAAISASFTAIPYVEFDTASMPNLTSFGLAVPTMVLVVSAVRHRDRIPLAILALLGVFSVHITGGVVTVLLVTMWWLVEALWHPVRRRVTDFTTLLLIAIPTVALLVPQFVGVLQQAEIIAGHAFVTHEGKKRALFDAVVQHTRHLNDFPIQWTLVTLAAIGAVILLVKRIWWSLAVWLLLVVVDRPLVGTLWHSARRGHQQIQRSVLQRSPATFGGGGHVVGGLGRHRGVHDCSPRSRPGGRSRPPEGVVRGDGGGAYRGHLATAWHAFPRHEFLFGDKYDSVIVDDKDLEAFAYLATLPGARDTLIGNANTDGTAWMYAVAGLHPLWTHYDYPFQQGPGYHRFIFWAYADDADTDPRVAEAVKALNIRYVVTSTPVVRGFVMPDGLVSLDRSRSWEKIYDNGEARIYEWRGH